MSKPKERKKGRRLTGSAPIAGQYRTAPETTAHDPMADPVESRMKGEGLAL